MLLVSSRCTFTNKAVLRADHTEATLLPPTRGNIITNGLHKNVIVQFCMSYEVNSVGIHNPVNNETLAQLRAWRNITSSGGLWVWHYMGNIGFPIAPYPYYAALADDIESLAAVGVSGYFGQSASEGGADMSELRAFLIGRKTFDPTLDTAALVREFVTNFYGHAAAPFVMSYMDIMRMAFVAYGGRDVSPSSALYTNSTVINAAAAMTAAAQAAMNDSDTLNRFQFSTQCFSAGTNTLNLRRKGEAAGGRWQAATSASSSTTNLQWHAIELSAAPSACQPVQAGSMDLDLVATVAGTYMGISPSSSAFCFQESISANAHEFSVHDRRREETLKIVAKRQRRR
jgi:hypothetical protein